MPKLLKHWLNMRKRLSTKITALLVFGILTSLFIYGILSLWISVNTYNSVLKEANEDYTQWAAREIQSHIKNNINVLKSLAEILGKSNLSKQEKENIVQQILVNTKHFNYIDIVSPEGSVLITTKTNRKISDYSKTSDFLNGQKDVFISETISIDEGSAFPQLHVSMPIKHFNKLSGVLIASIDLRKMCEIIESIRIGKTGRALVIDSKSAIIAHADLEYVINKRTVDITPENIDKFYHRINSKGKKIIGTLTPIKELGWDVLFEMEVSEAYAPAKTIIIISIILMITAICFSFWSSSKFARIILAPIEMLSKAMQQFSKAADYDEIEVRSIDEIGMLANGFNMMSSEIKQKEQKLREIEEDLKHSERLSTIGTISSKILHEIRTPLASLNLNLKCLLDNSRTENEKQEAGRNVVKLMQRTEAVTTNLLGYAKRREINMQPHSISAIIDELKILFAHYNNKKITIKFDEGTAHSVLVDKSLVIQVFSNLIKNAVEALEDSGLVLVRYYEQEGCLVTEVADNGKGIGKEDMNNIFNMFHTSKKHGTGLGLPIVKQIVRDLDGKIEIKSKLGEGTTCFVYLRLCPQKQTIKTGIVEKTVC